MKAKFLFPMAAVMVFLAGKLDAQCVTNSTVLVKTHTDITCFGSNDGTITIQLSIAVDNFELFDNSTGAFVTLLVTENQTANAVTYTNVYPSSFQVVAFKSGCSPVGITEGPLGIVVEEPASLVVNIDQVEGDTNPAAGAGTGSIAITISGGTAPYSYVWSDGATMEDRENLDAGEYHLTVTDSKGCSATKDILIENSAGLRVSSSQTTTNELSIYPNPTTSKNLIVNVEKSGNGLIQLLDLQGNIRHEQTIEGSVNEIPTQKLDKGIYLIKVTQGEKTYRERIQVN